MKKLIINLLVFLCVTNVVAQTYASKVIYSNQLTHCYVTAVAIDDSTVLYNISETSNKHPFRFSDKYETQSLGYYDKKTTAKIFLSALELLKKTKRMKRS